MRQGDFLAAPACPHCGHPHTSKAEPPPPKAADTTECPKCAANIKQAALVCPHCSFDVAGYRENIRDAKHTEMTPFAVNDQTKEQALAMVYSQSSGCMGWMMIGVSLVIWIVPIAGWVAAPLCLIVGIVTLISPVTGGKWADRTFNPEELKKKEAQALQRLQNAYQSVACPSCNHVEDDVTWEGPGGWFDCPQCARRLIRQESLLYYIPKPDALTSNSLKAFAEQQANARNTYNT